MLMSTFTAATLLNIIVKIYKQTKSSNKKKKNCFLINSLESGEKAVKMTMSLTSRSLKYILNQWLSAYPISNKIITNK